jgi:hypothetical protein
MNKLLLTLVVTAFAISSALAAGCGGCPSSKGKKDSEKQKQEEKQQESQS